jgi:hypothetical protein
VSLETQLSSASTRDQYVVIPKIALVELADVLRQFACDEGLQQPFESSSNSAVA